MEYLILKLEGDDVSTARPISVVSYEGDEPLEALPQGFVGPGTYVIVNWTERKEGELGQGPVEVTPVQAAPPVEEGGA